MVRRRINQERLMVGGTEPRGGTPLDEVAALIDWAELDRLLAGISASPKPDRHAGRAAAPVPPP